MKRLKDWLDSNPSLKPVLFAASLILFLVVVSFTIKIFKGNGMVYSVSYGVILGLCIGYLVQNKISNKIKIGTLGVFSGMGLDFLASSLSDKKGEDTINAINSMGSLIGNAAWELFKDENITKESDEIVRLITIGLWIFILVVGLVLLLATIFKDRNLKEPNGQQD